MFPLHKADIQVDDAHHFDMVIDLTAHSQVKVTLPEYDQAYSPWGVSSRCWSFQVGFEWNMSKVA